jgi:hypothetical protein
MRIGAERKKSNSHATEAIGLLQASPEVIVRQIRFFQSKLGHIFQACTFQVG